MHETPNYTTAASAFVDDFLKSRDWDKKNWLKSLDWDFLESQPQQHIITMAHGYGDGGPQ